VGDVIGAVIDMIAGPLGAAAGALLAVVAAWLAGKRSARQAAREEVLRGYQETRRRVDDAAGDLGDDPDVLREWLRERGRKP
jgi:hypothetical protein